MRGFEYLRMRGCEDTINYLIINCFDQILKYSNIQIFKSSNPQILKSSNTQILKKLHYRVPSAQRKKSGMASPQVGGSCRPPAISR